VTFDLDSLLNPQQVTAVRHKDGPLLILAGAGSGKTRVITYRIAWLHTQANVPLHRVLALTFTNKAAGEMRERVAHILGPQGGSGQSWISTFHSFCARLLRMYAEHLGLNPRFSIVDDGDQLAIIKRAVKNLELDVAPETLRGFLRTIDDAKNRGLDPEALHHLAIGAKAEQDADVYAAYQAELRRNDSLDFGDLIMESVRLLKTVDRVRQQCLRRWTHVMVDEFQDTNPVQYDLLQLLVGPDKNLVVVGDDDQSIYRWRGATVRNILDFEADFPNAAIVKLEQNYRSSQTILDAATAIVEKIERRRSKKLWTDQGEGRQISVFTGHHGREEAAWVALEIQRLAMRGEADFGECAVFYRTNAQSRLIEEEFRARGLPYQIVGGVSFYARSEVKDLLAYLKVALNTRDTIDLRRIVNVPRRGIGDKTLDRLEDFARTLGDGASLYDAIALVAKGNVEAEGLSGRQATAITELHALFDELRADIANSLPPSQLAQKVLERTDFLDWLDRSEPATAEDRKQNLYELIAAMADFERDPGGSLVDFLERSALVQQADTVDTDGDDARLRPSAPVTLMTVHAAKGLEFDAVFVTGLEDGLFPLIRDRDRSAPDLDERMEEERRLFYVAMTRARKYLAIANAQSRRLYGKDAPTLPSPFLDDLPLAAYTVAKESAQREVSWGARDKKRARHDVEMAAIKAFDEFDQTPEAVYRPAPVIKARQPRTPQFDEFDQRNVDYDDAWEPEPSDDADPDGGDVGRTVSHTREGFGTVTKASGSGDMASLTVVFASGRQLTIKRRFLKFY